MKRIALIVLCLALALSACTPKLAEGFSEEEVVNKAKEVISVINTLDYDSLNLFFRDDLRSEITTDTLKTAIDPLVGTAGAFKDYKSTLAAGSKDQNTQEDYATVVAVCEYESKTITYTISVDQQLNVVGLYLK